MNHQEDDNGDAQAVEADSSYVCLEENGDEDDDHDDADVEADKYVCLKVAKRYW